jgi:hypothetical protein
VSATTTTRQIIRLGRPSSERRRGLLPGAVQTLGEPRPTAPPVATAPPEPLAWARENATIVHPARGRVPFDPYPYQADFLAAHTAPRRVVLKARQLGFSQVIALEALYYGIHESESTILLVSRSQDLATNLLRYCYLTYNGLREAPALRKANESEMGFANGSRIKSIPANRSTGRGFAASRVYLDEFAYADYADDIYQSVSPAVSQGGTLTIGSTPNGNTNLFYELWENGHEFARFLVPWHACPAYYTDAERAAATPHDQAAWYLRERPKFTAAQWAAEYDCDFGGSGQAVFSLAAIEGAEAGAVGDQEPREDRDYLAMADIGRRNDATVINVVDTTERPYQRVYHERLERVPYPIIQERLAAVAGRYEARLLVESNGIGDPVIENTDYLAEPFVTSSKSKTQAIQGLALLLEQGDLKALWTPQERRELKAYRWDDGDLTQDCVMSLAIGAHVLTQRQPEVRMRWL